MDKKRILITASMACADFANLGEAVRALELARVDALHFDFCDGHFAPTFLFSCPILRSIRPLTNLRFDVHLYCEYPSRYLDELASSGADLAVVQVESKEDYRNVINRVREKGMKAGVGILPETPVPHNVKEVLPYVSLVIANTVGPAYAGQRFDVRGLRNIEHLSEIITTHGYGADIGADGGVGIETLDALLGAGANLLICGTRSIFRTDLDLTEAVKSFRKEVESRYLL